MDVDPSGPSYRARRASFLSSSVAPFTHFGPSLFEKDGQLGWQLKNYRLTVQCSLVDGWNDGVNSDKVNGLMIGKAEVVRYTKVWQADRKHLWRITRVIFWLVFISDRSVASSSVYFSYKNHSLLLSFLYFSQKHIVKARPSYLSEICPFNSYILRSHLFTLWLGKWFLPLSSFLFHFSFSLKTLYLAFVPHHPFQTRQS